VGSDTDWTWLHRLRHRSKASGQPLTYHGKDGRLKEKKVWPQCLFSSVSAAPEGPDPFCWTERIIAPPYPSPIMGSNLRIMSLMTVILPSFPRTTTPPAHNPRLTSSTIMHTTHKHCLIAAKEKHVYRPIRGRLIKSTPLSYASRSTSDMYVKSVIMTAVFSVVLRVCPDPLRDPFTLPSTGYQG
jgi:hypothetical protein